MSTTGSFRSLKPPVSKVLDNFWKVDIVKFSSADDAIPLVCKGLVEAHGGKIWATNNPDRGATFSITLPLTRE